MAPVVALHRREAIASRVVDREALSRLPKPTPMIGETLDRGNVAMLAGMWGSAKSFVALDWAACIATGKPWQGRRVDRGRVLYVIAEGAQGLSVRLDAWGGSVAVQGARLTLGGSPRPGQSVQHCGR